MDKPAKFPENRPLLWLLVILSLIALVALLLPPHFALGLASYLPLHTAIETFSVVVAMLVFVVGSNIHRGKIAANLVLLSCAFLAVGLLDFGHFLSSGGMPDFVTPSGAEKAIYFWLAARTILVLTLLAIAVQPWQREAGARLQTLYLAAALALVAGAYWLILFHQDSLPRVFDPASGLTPFNRGVEYLFAGIMGATAILLYRRKKTLQCCNTALLLAAVVVMGLDELFFAAYVGISDHLNLLGHVYKIIAYYLLYRAVVAYAVHQPYRQLAQSEQQLRESAENLALLKHQNDLILNAAGEGICGLDTHGTIVFANPAAARMLGYPVMELFGCSLHDTTHHTRLDGSPYPAADCPILASLNSGQTCHEGDEFYYRRDGSRFPVEYTSTPIIDEGKSIGAVVMFSDITDRRQAEVSLLRWQQFVEHATWGMAVGDFESRTIALANPAYAHMHGYHTDEIIGMSAWELYAPESRPELPRLHEALKQAGHLSFECERQRKDGSTFPALVDIAALYDAQGTVEGYIANVQDITARKHAEEMLRWSEERFRSTFEQAAVGMVHAMQNGTFLRVNQKFCEIVGYSRAELTHMRFHEITYPDDLEKNLDYLRQALDGKIASYAMEKRYVRKDQTPVWCSLTVSPLRKDDGALDYFIGVIEDITVRKRAELQLRELSTHLQTVREEEKARIAREIHDDLGSTLTALKMDVYWLARLLPAEKEALPLLERVESLSGLLDDAVVATRRIISELRPTVLDDLGLLAALEWQCTQFHKRTGIECRVHGVKDDGTQDKLDSKQAINLFRISQEALTNVSRHSGASSVEVEFFQGEDEILLSISDNGLGLLADRAIAATSYGMRGMAERAGYLGGTLKFDSSPGGGTTVTVKLPTRLDEAL